MSFLEMIYVCCFRRQSDNYKITRPRSIQTVNVQVQCERSSIVLIRAVLVNFTTTLDKSKRRSVTNGTSCLLPWSSHSKGFLFLLWQSRSEKNPLAPKISVSRLTKVLPDGGTVPHPIMQFHLGSRLHKKPRPEKVKPFPLAARFSNLITLSCFGHNLNSSTVSHLKEKRCSESLRSLVYL